MRSGSYAQQDAEEFVTQLFGALRKLPRLANVDRPGPNALEQLFQGELEVTWSCKDNAQEAVQVTRAAFDKLPCHIKGGTGKDATNFLTDGLKESLKELVEKNSPSLKRQAMYEKSSLVARLPFYLTVQFVRFFWKKAQATISQPDKVGNKAKIVRPVEFPFSLDLAPYCTEEVRKTLYAARDIESKAGEKMDVSPPASYENKTGWYDLWAVLSHQGRSADGGHYVAWVRQEGGDDWLEFNDAEVRPRRREEISALSGKGGADWHIAYLLFYKSRTSKPADQIFSVFR